MSVSRLITLLLACAIGFHAVRTAAVRLDPDVMGAALWQSHPRVELQETMSEIGASAARQQPLTRDLMRQVESVAAKAPLAPEPFLIKATMAQLEGKGDQAERLLVAARKRDPRSPAARYFLAERFLRTNRIQEGLTEIAVLARFLPGAGGPFAPALAAYAQTPGAVPVLRRFFRENPDLEPGVLLELSKKPEHVDLVLGLWSGRRATALAASGWQTSLVQRLIEAGEFARAHRVWTQISGAHRYNGGIFNAGFGEITAPPPFNWTFPNVGGVAEPRGGGRLQLLYFGGQDAVLAEQLLLLAPGQYYLQMEVSGGTSEQNAIAWNLRCVPSGQGLLELPIGIDGGRRSVRGTFTVPAGCRAQRLQLAASAGEFSRSTELSISKLRLEGPRS